MIIINHFYYLYVYGFMGTPAVWRFIGHTFGVRVHRVRSLTLIVPPLAVARELDSQGAAGD